MSNQNTTPVAEVYVVITYSVFGSVQTTKAFYAEKDAEECVIEWGNMNSFESTELFTSSSEVIEWFSEHEEDVEISITMEITDVNGSKAYINDDYEMLAGENKLMAEFFTNLGYTNEQISEIANTGKLNVNVIQEPQNRVLKEAIGSKGYELATLMLEANAKRELNLSENDLVHDNSVPSDSKKDVNISCGNEKDIYRRYAIIKHIDNEGSQTLEDYDNEETARTAFEAIRRDGYFTPEHADNPRDIITFDEFKKVVFTMWT